MAKNFDKLLTIQEILESWMGIKQPFLEIERFDIASVNGIVEANNGGLMADPHILVIVSPNQRINNSVLAIRDGIAFVFSGEDNAVNFDMAFNAMLESQPHGAEV